MKTAVQSLIVGLMMFGCLSTAWATSWLEQQEINRNEELNEQNLMDTERRAGDAICWENGADECSKRCTKGGSKYYIEQGLAKDCKDSGCVGAAVRKCQDICLRELCYGDGQGSSPAEPSIGDAMKALGNAAEENRKAQAALQSFVDACNAFFRSPAGKYASGGNIGGRWCKCLGDHYRGVMTSEDEARYGNDFERLFWNEIAQSHSTDPGWPRLHPAVSACLQ